ncbi:MAG: hypothetical protein HYV97_01035 [Bdellovibrio sp.]|nr:hypothetical protein [Bdellovibrio sp.]
MELLKLQNNHAESLCDMNFRLENKKYAVRIRKRVKCDSCGKFFLQRSRDVRHCIRCCNGEQFGR